MGALTVGLFPDLAVRPLTRRFVGRLLFDLPPSPAMVTDFGVESEDHYRALKDALFAAQVEIEADAEEGGAVLFGLRQRMVELDRALGNGARLTAFVRQYAPHMAKQVRFHTFWDTLYGRRATEKL